MDNWDEHGQATKHPRIELLTVSAALVFPWLLAEPFVLGEGANNTLLGLTVSIVGMLLVPVTLMVGWLRPAIAWLGFVVVLSAFVVWESAATSFSHLICGVFLMVVGWAPGLLRFVVPAGTVDSSRLVREPLTPGRSETKIPVAPPTPVHG